jgi:hypothetical protein
MLTAMGTQLSMAVTRQPTQKHYARHVIRTIKEEEVYQNECPDLATACREIGHFIDDVYQPERIHSALAVFRLTEDWGRRGANGLCGMGQMALTDWGSV